METINLNQARINELKKMIKVLEWDLVNIKNPEIRAIKLSKLDKIKKEMEKLM
ncbi:MAG: hypothetical protein KKF44_09020 [Nanoarchaeota archaeon]|nr:hypothetical protein [Nanoarchaeota archaeon]